MALGLTLALLLALEVVINFSLFEDYRTPQWLLCMRLAIAAPLFLLPVSWPYAALACSFAATYPLEIRQSVLILYSVGFRPQILLLAVSAMAVASAIWKELNAVWVLYYVALVVYRNGKAALANSVIVLISMTGSFIVGAGKSEIGWIRDISWLLQDQYLLTAYAPLFLLLGLEHFVSTEIRTEQEKLMARLYSSAALTVLLGFVWFLNSTPLEIVVYEFKLDQRFFALALYLLSFAVFILELLLSLLIKRTLPELVTTLAFTLAKPLCLAVGVPGQLPLILMLRQIAALRNLQKHSGTEIPLYCLAIASSISGLSRDCLFDVSYIEAYLGYSKFKPTIQGTLIVVGKASPWLVGLALLPYASMVHWPQPMPVIPPSQLQTVETR